jgi:hypothetical protein
MPGRAVQHDALLRIDLARVVLRGRVQPEFQHPARHVERAGDVAELLPLAHVADVEDLHVAPRHLRSELLVAQVLDALLRRLHHLAHRLLRNEHG